MVSEKAATSQAWGGYQALGLKGCVFTLDAEHAQKSVSSALSPRAIICSLRSRTTNQACAVSLNWEPQDETQPARTRARPRAATGPASPSTDFTPGQGVVSPYALGKPDQDRAPLGAHGLQAQPGNGLCAKTTEVVFCISSASNHMLARWN